MMKMTFVIVGLVALGSLLSACTADGQGYDNLQTTTSALKADGTGDADNCETVYNPPDVDLGKDCLVNADCNDVAPLLASGNPAPAFCGTQANVDQFGWDPATVGRCFAQSDLDGDAAGDACDDDDDGDHIADTVDNCPEVANTDQLDTDEDDLGNVCDDDDDNDGVLDEADNCPLVENADQVDSDKDGVGDACTDDNDGDGVLDDVDNCPDTVNPDQVDTDGDKQGDACDTDDDNDGSLDVDDCEPLNTAVYPEAKEVCNGVDDNCDEQIDEGFTNTDGDGLADCVDDDDDNDGVPDVDDNCPLVSNPLQSDQDGDDMGNVCDDDLDGDGVPNTEDNCPFIVNTDQADQDKDKIGDACDTECDEDGVPGSCDPDADGDGYAPPEDCMEGDPFINPGATEACNGYDDNCDGKIDDGSLCKAGEVCQGVLGCQPAPEPECTQDADCDDGNICTKDTCVQGVCGFAPVEGCCLEVKDCDDGNLCTDDVCVEGTCGHLPVENCCTLDADCDDGNANTTDTCVNNACVYTPLPQPEFPIFAACLAAPVKEMWEGANPTTNPDVATGCCYKAPWCTDPAKPVGCIGWNDAGGYCAP